MKIKNLFIITLLTISLGLVSCSDDDGPNGSVDRIDALADIAGTWVCTERGSTDYMVMAVDNNPSQWNMNRMAINWDDVYYDCGVPRIYSEDGIYKMTAASINWKIVSFSQKRGTMEIYNPVTDTTKKFALTAPSMGVISNTSTSQSFASALVSVYDSATDEIICTVSLGSIGMLDKSTPFWLCGGRAGKVDVYAGFYDTTGKLLDTASWTDMDPENYWTLTY